MYVYDIAIVNMNETRYQAHDHCLPVVHQTFADIVGSSRQAITVKVGTILTPGAPLGQWLSEYCYRLREQAAGRATNGDLDLATERARLAKEQADAVALKNAIARNEYAPYHLLTEALAKVSHELVSILEALPVKLKKTSEQLTAEELALIEQEIVKARNTMAAIRLTDADLPIGDEEN